MGTPWHRQQNVGNLFPSKQRAGMVPFQVTHHTISFVNTESIVPNSNPVLTLKDLGVHAQEVWLTSSGAEALNQPTVEQLTTNF